MVLVKDLKAELKKLGLLTSGTKVELQARLDEHRDDPGVDAPAEEVPADESMPEDPPTKALSTEEAAPVEEVPADEPVPAEAAAVEDVPSDAPAPTKLEEVPAAAQKGVVKKWVSGKNLGFITPEGGEGSGRDVFVHARCLSQSGVTSLIEGEQVEFVAQVDFDGRCAPRCAHAVSNHSVASGQCSLDTYIDRHGYIDTWLAAGGV